MTQSDVVTYAGPWCYNLERCSGAVLCGLWTRLSALLLVVRYFIVAWYGSFMLLWYYLYGRPGGLVVYFGVWLSPTLGLLWGHLLILLYVQVAMSRLRRDDEVQLSSAVANGVASHLPGDLICTVVCSMFPLTVCVCVGWKGWRWYLQLNGRLDLLAASRTWPFVRFFAMFFFWTWWSALFLRLRAGQGMFDTYDYASVVSDLPICARMRRTVRSFLLECYMHECTLVVFP